MNNILIWLYHLLLFPILIKCVVLIRLLTKEYSNMKLCCRVSMVILNVSTFFFLRHHAVFLPRARELDVKFIKTITGNTNACEYCVDLSTVIRGQYQQICKVMDDNI